MKELNQITNEVIEQSEELLEHMENDLEIEMVRQELDKLERQRTKMYNFMLSIGMMTALYSLMVVMKTIMMVIQ